MTIKRPGGQALDAATGTFVVQRAGGKKRMGPLNQVKVIKALEKALEGPHSDFIYAFLKAYGAPASTVKLLQLRDGYRNVASVPGDLALKGRIWFRAVSVGTRRREEEWRAAGTLLQRPEHIHALARQRDSMLPPPLHAGSWHGPDGLLHVDFSPPHPGNLLRPGTRPESVQQSVTDLRRARIGSTEAYQTPDACRLSDGGTVPNAVLPFGNVPRMSLLGSDAQTPRATPCRIACEKSYRTLTAVLYLLSNSGRNAFLTSAGEILPGSAGPKAGKRRRSPRRRTWTAWMPLHCGVLAFSQSAQRFLYRISAGCR